MEFASLVTTHHQAILAVVKGSQGNPRLSAYVLQRAILHFYTSCKLFPAGVIAELESVQVWSLKCGKALRRLVHGTQVDHNFVVLTPDVSNTFEVILLFWENSEPFLFLKHFAPPFLDPYKA